MDRGRADIVYGLEVEYRFEVAATTVDWAVRIVPGALLAVAYRREVNGSRWRRN